MKVIVFLFIFIFTLQADNLLTHLFEQLKSTPQKEKFKIMNEIKQHIVQLKQQERIEAIKLLQEKKRLENTQPKELAVVVENQDRSMPEEMYSSESCMGESTAKVDGVHQHMTEHSMQPQIHEQMHNNMQNMQTIRDAQAREEMMRNHGSMQPNRQEPSRTQNPSMGGNR